MIEAGRLADAGRFDTVWTYDHFSGLVSGGRWSRDPWVVLAAIAATTERIHIGVLVANIANRHPAQLASAVNSLQSLAPGRVMLGIGAGASAGNSWAAENAAIRRPVAGIADRRAMLGESIDALRAVWRGEAYEGAHVSVDAAIAVTDGAPAPPIIVGGTSKGTIDVACARADGVNIELGDDLSERIAYARGSRAGGFEISVFDAFRTSHPFGGDADPLAALGVDRRTLWVTAPYPMAAISSVGAVLV